MSQVCEDRPLWMDSYDAEDWMSKTPEITDDCSSYEDRVAAATAATEGDPLAAWKDYMPEIDPELLEAIEDFIQHDLDPELSKKIDAAIEAEVDILDWAAEKNPEHDPENYTCWSYSEYKKYMRETFCYIPDGFWQWFELDDMILHFWREHKYDLVYLEGNEPILIGDTWRVPNSIWDVEKWLKTDKSKFYILQYGKPPIHPLMA